jgi:hypothetical protein
VVVLVVVVLGVVELAAFASAAPVPASAPVTIAAIITGFIRRPIGLTSLERVLTTQTVLRGCRSNVGDP